MVTSLVQRGSEEYLITLKTKVIISGSHRSIKERKRLIASTPVFAVNVLGVYTMDRMAPITTLSVASIYIMTILVMFPHKFTISGIE
jgi:hypothetical protein